MRLSEAQLNYFQTFGFLKFPGLLADQINEIEAAFESIWLDGDAGDDRKPHDGRVRSCIVPFIDQSERLCQLIDDDGIVGIASSLLGEDFNYCSSDGNYYVGDTAWHSDGWRPADGYLYLKMAIYLDPLTKDNGCLRVVPGSHYPGDWFSDRLHAELRLSQEKLGSHGGDIPATSLETMPGDLLVFNHNVKHASFGGGSARRMFTINLSPHIREEHRQVLLDYIATRARFWIDRAYGEKMMRTAGPERLRHLTQIMTNDGHLAALAQQARKTMAEPARG